MVIDVLARVPVGAHEFLELIAPLVDLLPTQILLPLLRVSERIAQRLRFAHSIGHSASAVELARLLRHLLDLLSRLRVLVHINVTVDGRAASHLLYLLDGAHAAPGRELGLLR